MRTKPTGPRGPKGRNERRTREAEPAERHEPSKVIYGLLPVVEALRAANRKVDKVMIAAGAREDRLNEIFDLCRERSVALSRASNDAFSKYLPAGVNHQGVIAFTAAVAYYTVHEVLAASSSQPLLLILDGVEDPRNFGAILRTAECSGVDGVIIPERRAVGLTDTVAKSSAGSIEHVKVARTTNLNRLIEDLKRQDIWVVGTSVDASISYTEWDWSRPSALVMGGEGRGLHRLVAENCDILVRIPMYGSIDSLNVSVAAGVILFEAKRQRKEDE